MKSEPCVAFIVDALASIGGGERTLFAALEAYPRADIFTLVYNREVFAATPIANHKVMTSALDRLPLAHRHHRAFLPLMPAAIERFDLRRYDIVVSFSYAVAHGVRTPEATRHLTYMYTPMRYAWNDINLDGTHSRKNPVINLIMKNFRQWDHCAAARVNEFAAISQVVAGRIQAAYQRESRVLYPPVELDRFRPHEPRASYYVTLSRLVAHKRIDLVVRAFSQLNLPLLVIGDGPERAHLQALAGQNVQFLGYQSDEKAAELLSRARGFVCATEEDFGIAIVEAQAAGCPVLAYARGGACETVADGITGLFFAEQSVPSLIECIQRHEAQPLHISAQEARQHTEHFSRERFIREFAAFVENKKSGQ